VPLWQRTWQAGKRKISRRLGFLSDQIFYLDSAMKTPRSDVERLALYSPAVQLDFLSPVDLSPMHNFYQPRHVYGIGDATVDPLSGLVYDHAGVFIAESSSWLPSRQFYSWPKPFLKKHHHVLRGEYIFFPTNGYYHWLIEDLPVFLHSLAKAPGAKVLCSHLPAPYVKEVLASIANEVVFISRPTAVELLVLTAKTGGLGSPVAGLTPHPADIATLRQHFASALSTEPPSEKLYASRIGQSRSPSNEAALEARVREHGYRSFSGAGLTLRQQAAIFSRATRIVGVHGAGLANVIWCQRGVSLLELFAGSYLPSCYSALTSIRGGSYNRLIYCADDDNVVHSSALEKVAAGPE